MDRIKVLVVDDEIRMRKLVKDFLKKKNFDVIEACDGEGARRAMYEHLTDSRRDAQQETVVQFR